MVLNLHKKKKCPYCVINKFEPEKMLEVRGLNENSYMIRYRNHLTSNEKAYQSSSHKY